jgi:hypothetical protein
MTQPTSAQTYYDILQSGELGDRQRTVLKLLMDKGPLTGSEINEALDSHSGHKRLSELEKMGVIRAGPSRVCKVTQREAIEWEVTGRKPSPIPKSPDSTPSRKTLEGAVKEIRALVQFRKLQDPAYNIPSDLYDVGIWLKRKAKM